MRVIAKREYVEWCRSLGTRANDELPSTNDPCLEQLIEMSKQLGRILEKHGCRP